MNSSKKPAHMNSSPADTCSLGWEADDGMRQERDCPWEEEDGRTVWDLQDETRKTVRLQDQLLDSSRMATDVCNDWVVYPLAKEASHIVLVFELEGHGFLVGGSSDCAGLFLILETCHMVIQPLVSVLLPQHSVHRAWSTQDTFPSPHECCAKLGRC